MSKEEALQYLKVRKINKEQAAQIYELTGGRMVHLESVADGIKANRTFEGMCIAYYTENRISFSPFLQIYARRCSPMLKDNFGPLTLLFTVVITRTEPRLYVNFWKRDPSHGVPSITW